MYRPLPPEVTIRASGIQGLGLFATEDLEAGHEFGITHIKDGRFQNGYIRTPLGGFFNHSKTPNCETYIDGDFILLKTIVGVESGTELTSFYQLYEVK